jgi:hypothetical protein
MTDSFGRARESPGSDHVARRAMRWKHREVTPRTARTRRLGLIAAGIAVLSGAGLAHSAIPDKDKVIHACYDTADGTLHVIDTEAGAACSRTQVALDWNQMGPPGPPDPAPKPEDLEARRAQLGKLLARKTKKPSPKLFKKLVAAPAVPSEARSTWNDDFVIVPFSFTGKTVASLGLPAGRWVIHAKALTYWSTAHYTTSTETPNIWCVLRAGADSDAAYATQGTLAPHLVHRFTKPGLAELSCSAFPLDMALHRIKITAIRVSKLTNTPAGGG